MANRSDPIPAWQLYGEDQPFPDLLHVERIVDRAEGLDWVIAPHRHLHLHQIFLLSSGDVQLSVDGVNRAVAPPVIVNIPRGTVHGFAFAAGTEGFVLTLLAADHPDLFAPGAETATVLGRAFTGSAPPGLAADFAALAALHAGAGPFRRTALRGAALSLVTGVLAALGAQPADGDAAGRADPRFQRFEAQVRAGLRERRGVRDHARELAVSPRHLSRLCRAATGLSAQDYIELQVIREACRLLVYTRMPAQQVAFHLGFDDPSYFSRVFQRSMRLSPTAYRQRFDAAGGAGAAG